MRYTEHQCGISNGTYQVLIGHATPAASVHVPYAIHAIDRTVSEAVLSTLIQYAQHGRDHNKHIKSCLFYPSDMLLPELHHGGCTRLGRAR